jgi:hypothetical protein
MQIPVSQVARNRIAQEIPIACGNLPAATGQTGRNTQTGRRGQETRRPLRRRQTDPAGAASGSAKALGSDVFRAQLRLSPATLGPPGGGPGGKQSREDCRNQRADKGDIIQRKRDDTPCGGQFYTRDQGKRPDHNAGQDAHESANDYVALKFCGDVDAGHLERPSKFAFFSIVQFAFVRDRLQANQVR